MSAFSRPQYKTGAEWLRRAMHAGITARVSEYIAQDGAAEIILRPIFGINWLSSVQTTTRGPLVCLIRRVQYLQNCSKHRINFACFLQYL